MDQREEVDESISVLHTYLPGIYSIYKRSLAWLTNHSSPFSS
ncbi:unnamed protein product [Brugia timori]|uniref:Uncharacterized protein n=1 Tax=Brugia timori TaxID=42155 RepID=A0A0R3Q960_9BILA|nr:unnamed protein product [Brugia timori]